MLTDEDIIAIEQTEDRFIQIVQDKVLTQDDKDWLERNDLTVGGVANCNIPDHMIREVQFRLEQWNKRAGRKIFYPEAFGEFDTELDIFGYIFIDGMELYNFSYTVVGEHLVQFQIWEELNGEFLTHEEPDAEVGVKFDGISNWDWKVAVQFCGPETMERHYKMMQTIVNIGYSVLGITDVKQPMPEGVEVKYLK